MPNTTGERITAYNHSLNTDDNEPINRLRALGSILSDMNHDINTKKQELARDIDTMKTALSYEIHRVELQQESLKTAIEKNNNKLFWKIAVLFLTSVGGMAYIFWNMLTFALAQVAK